MICPQNGTAVLKGLNCSPIRETNYLELWWLVPQTEKQFALLELQSRFGDAPVKFQVVYPKLSPKRDCSPKRVKDPDEEYIPGFRLVRGIYYVESQDRIRRVVKMCWQEV